jgi:endo-1,4-beta-xylanase
MRRRDVLEWLVCGSAAALASPAGAGESETLAAAARKAGVVYGVAADREIFGDPACADLIAREAALFVPSNSLKMQFVAPTLGTLDFAHADALLDFARQHGLSAKGHVLAWNANAPAWSKNLSRGELAKTLDDYLERVATRYAGRMLAWDVVNEPFYVGGDHPGTWNGGPWLAAFGQDYVEHAFRRAAEFQAAPKLVLNEAWTERSDAIGLAVRKSLLTLIDQLQDRGVKIDAVGLQGHILPAEKWDSGSFRGFLEEIARRKLEIHVTEIDILDTDYPDDIVRRDAMIAARVHEVLAAALSCASVTMVVNWGLSSRHSWYNDPYFTSHYKVTREVRSLPYDAALRPAPMREAMLRAFRERKI